MDLKTGKTTTLDTGTRMAGPSRGGWDPFGNAWFGGKNLVHRGDRSDPVLGLEECISCTPILNPSGLQTQ